MSYFTCLVVVNANLISMTHQTKSKMIELSTHGLWHRPSTETISKLTIRQSPSQSLTSITATTRANLKSNWSNITVKGTTKAARRVDCLTVTLKGLRHQWSPVKVKLRPVKVSVVLEGTITPKNVDVRTGISAKLIRRIITLASILILTRRALALILGLELNTLPR